jgi:hypothetical protein
MMRVLIGSIVAANLLWNGPAFAEAGEKESSTRPTKCEVELWEAVSAVYYLVADSDNLAKHAFAAQFTDEVKEFENEFSALKYAGHHGPLEQDVAGIEEHWLEFKATGQAIVDKALTGQKAAAADLAKFWRMADAINEHLDEIIKVAAHAEM